MYTSTPLQMNIFLQISGSFLAPRCSTPTATRFLTFGHGSERR